MRTAALLLGVALATVVQAGAATDDFLVDTTEDIVTLCTTPESDPLYTASVSFCHGFLVGAWRYHRAIASRQPREIVCLPDPPPTRREAIEQFIAWAKGHPQYDREAPVEALFKFLVEKWPCRK